MQALDDIQTRIDEFSAMDSGLLQVDTAPLVLIMLRDALARDWDALAQSGETAVRLGRTLVDSAHEGSTRQRQDVLRRFREFEAAQLDTLKADDRVDLAVFADLEGNLSGGIVSILEGFDALRRANDASLRDNFERDLAVSLCVHGVKAKSFAGLNSGFEPVSGGESSFVEAHAREEVNRFEASLRSDQVKIFTSLVTNSKGPSLRAEIAHVCDRLQRAIPAFYSSLAPTVAAYLGEVNDRNVGRSDALGRVLLKANDSWREAVSSYAALHALRFHLLEFKRTGLSRSLVEKAATLAFDVDVPNGTNATIGDVASTEIDAFVELWGVVRAVDQKILPDDSLLSQMTVETVSESAKVECGVRFAHLTRMGIGPGTYVRVNGHTGDLDGKPGVIIDQLSHVELAKQSWRYALLRLSDRYFPRWRRNLNIGWIPMPHLALSQWEGGSVSGANEFIYSPFLR